MNHHVYPKVILNYASQYSLKLFYLTFFFVFFEIMNFTLLLTHPVQGVSNSMVLRGISKTSKGKAVHFRKHLLDFWKTFDGAVVPSTAALVSELRGVFEKITI